MPDEATKEPLTAVPVLRLRHLVLGASILIALLQAAGGAPGDAATAAGLLLAGLIGWKIDVRYLGSLLILSFASFGLSGSPEGLEVMGGLSILHPTRHTGVAGVDLSAPLVAMLAAAMRTLFEAAQRRETRFGWPERWPLLLFLLALILAAMGGLYGRSLGLNRWSEGVRSVLAVGGFFWGYALTRTPIFSARRSDRQVVRVTILGCVLVAMGLLRGHFIFVLAGLAAALLPGFLSRRKWGASLLAGWVCAYALVGLTLTTAAIVVLSAGIVILASMPLPLLRRMLVNGAVAVVLMGSVGVIWAVRAYGDTLAAELTLQAAESEGVLSYAIFKLMGDRGPLWLAALQQIVSGPHLVAPAGRPLMPMVGAVTGTVWEYGPHNSVLQVLRSIGLLGGAALLVLMAYFLFQALSSAAGRSSGAARALAAAFIGVALAGTTTGDFPVQDVGFFLWVMGGIAVGSSNRYQLHHHEIAATAKLPPVDRDSALSATGPAGPSTT
jgi:hypothetical protein